MTFFSGRLAHRLLPNWVRYGPRDRFRQRTPTRTVPKADRHSAAFDAMRQLSPQRGWTHTLTKHSRETKCCLYGGAPQRGQLLETPYSMS
jgi:hypothetical protein